MWVCKGDPLYKSLVPVLCLCISVHRLQSSYLLWEFSPRLQMFEYHGSRFGCLRKGSPNANRFSSIFPFIVLYTWWLIPLSKWVITPVINGISRVNPLITGVITHLLSGMSHQVALLVPYTPLPSATPTWQYGKPSGTSMTKNSTGISQPRLKPKGI